MTVTTFFGAQGPKPNQTTSTAPPTLSTAVSNARTDFLAAITQLGINTYENGTNAGSATFSYTGGTATWSNTASLSTNRVVTADVSGPQFGRYNMTPGVPVIPAFGGAYGHWLEGTGNFTYSFSTPISALAFYVVDLGDFSGTFTLTFYSGSTVVYTESAITNAIADTNGLASGNLAFYGMVSTVNFDRVVFSITQIGPDTDVIGFDQLIVGQAAAPLDLDVAGLTISTGTAALTTGVWMPRYQSGMVISTEADPREAMNELVRAMAGRHGWAGGTWRVKAGHMPTPVFAMDQSWLAKRLQEDGTPESGSTLSISNGVPREQKVNRVTGSCIDPTQRYQALPFPAVQDSVLIAAEGATYPLEVQYQAAVDIFHAQQLAKITIKQGQAPLRMQASCNLFAYAPELFDTGTLTLPDYGISEKTMEVRGWRWHPTEGVQLQLAEITQAIYDIEGALSGRDPAPNTNLPTLWDVEVPTNVQVSSGTPALTDASALTRTRITWDAAVSQSIRVGGKVEVQYALMIDTGPLAWQSWEEDGDATSATIPALLARAWYVFRVRFITAVPFRVRGDWSMQVLHRIATPPDIYGPSAPPSFGTLRYDDAGPVVYSTAAGYFELGRIDFGPYSGDARIEVTEVHNDTFDINAAYIGPPAPGAFVSRAYLEDSVTGAGAVVAVGVNDVSLHTNLVSMSRTIFLPSGTTGWVRVMGYLNEPTAGTSTDTGYETTSQATDIHIVLTAFAA